MGRMLVCVALLATKRVLTRPWCLLEVHEAARHGYDEAALRAFRDHLVRLLTD